MARSIWKFPIEIDDHQVIALPNGAKIRSVAVQGDTVCLWAEVDTNEPLFGRNIFVYGTGHPMPDDPGTFIGSFMLRDGALVFHVYEDARSGDVECGPIAGGVHTMSGDVTCDGDITGSVQTMSGSVRAGGSIAGSANSMSGRVCGA